MLALRTWYAIHPSGEFRCFVRHRRIVGVSQRHTNQRFDFLDASMVDKMRGELAELFETKVRDAFPLRDYVLDAYRDRRGRWWVVDFAPFGYDSDSLLFSWDELSAQNASLACCEHALPAGEDASAGAGCGAGSESNESCGDSSGDGGSFPFRVVTDAPAMSFPPLTQHRYPDDLLALAAAARSGGNASDEPSPNGPLDDIISQLQRQGLFQGQGDSDDDGDDTEGGGSSAGGAVQGYR